MYSKMAGALSGAAFSFIAIHPRCLDWGHLGAAAGSIVSWLTQLVLVVLLVRRRGLGHLVWGRRSSSGSGSGSGSSNSRPLDEIVWDDEQQQQRVCSSRGLCAYLAISVPAALVWWLEWWSCTHAAGLKPGGLATRPTPLSMLATSCSHIPLL